MLLAEDSDVVREQLKRVLEAHGYEVVTARDGAEALELAERDAAGFDLVSTDVMMPNLDGYELTRALRQHPRHRDVPLIMVTSKGEHLDRVRGFDAGVDEYMTKPLDARRARARHRAPHRPHPQEARVNVYVLAAGSVLPEFVRRPLAAGGHDVQRLRRRRLVPGGLPRRAARRRRGRRARRRRRRPRRRAPPAPRRRP